MMGSQRNIGNLLSALADPKQVNARLAEIAKATADYEAKRGEAERVITEANAARATAERAEASLKAVGDGLKAREAALASGQAGIAAAQEDLTQQRADLALDRALHLSQKAEVERDLATLKQALHDQKIAADAFSAELHARNNDLKAREAALKRAEGEHASKVAALQSHLSGLR